MHSEKINALRTRVSVLECERQKEWERVLLCHNLDDEPELKMYMEARLRGVRAWYAVVGAFEIHTRQRAFDLSDWFQRLYNIDDTLDRLLDNIRLLESNPDVRRWW